MFSRAPLKRFNELVSDTPAPGSYDVKDLASKGQGIAAVKSDRFVVPKEITPGPGQYDVDKPKVVHSRPSILARQSSFKTSSQNGSRASSSASLYTEVDDTISFKTPSKKSGSSLLIAELQQKYDKVAGELQIAHEELSRLLSERDVLRTSLGGKISELESGVRTKEDELVAKVTELERVTEERNSAENRLNAVENELEEVRCREQTLKRELEMLNQDNLTLEENIGESTAALLEEKKALEEKSTFLHFTQEQLNLQVGQLESEVARLKGEVDELKQKLVETEAELAKERCKLAEFTEMYIKENKETEEEFSRLQTEVQDLKTEVQDLKDRNSKLASEHDTIDSKLSELKAEVERTTEEKSKVEHQLHEICQDVEVLNNDKEVLDSERRRLENEKNELGLDLMSVTSEKIQIEKEMSQVVTEMSILRARIAEAETEKSRLQEELAAADRDRKAIENDVADIRDVAMKQQLSLNNKDQEIGDLRSEVQELEMKNSSLEGSLSATLNEVSNVKAENDALFRSNEKIEETVRGYIHKCQDLELLNDELQAAKDDLNQTLLILEKRMVETETGYDETNCRLAELTSSVKEKVECIEKMKGDVESLESKNTDLQEMISILRQQNQTRADIAEETEAGLRRKISELDELIYRSREQTEKLESDLDSVRCERRQLLDLNGVMSQQIADGLVMTERLTSREEELNKRLDKLKHELDIAHQGMDTEVDQRWQAEDEILHLQAENDRISVTLQEVSEQLKMLRDQLVEKDANLDGANTAKINLESKLTKLQEDFDIQTRDFAVLRQDHNEISSKVKTERELRTGFEEKLRITEKSSKDSCDILKTQKREISSLKQSLEAQQKVICEQESNISALENELVGVERLAKRYNEMESLLEEYLNRFKEFEAREEQLVEESQKKDELIAELRNDLDPLHEDAKTYREKYEGLLAIVEPYRDQLEMFEAEKAALLNQNKEAKVEVQKLAAQHAQLLGHQNHKQKIKYLVQIQNENVSLKEQVAKLELENSKQKRVIKNFERESTKAHANKTFRFNATQVADKENDSTMFFTPMPSNVERTTVLQKIPFAASTPHSLRRQTIASSPLTNTNRL